MKPETFQEHVMTQFDQIQKQFIKNEEDHGKLSAKVESIRTEVESVRSEIHKAFNSHLRWSIGISISLVGAVFIIVKYIT